MQEGAEVAPGDLFKGGSTLFVELNVNCVDAFVDCLSHCLIVCLFVLSGFHARYRCDKPRLRMVGERRRGEQQLNFAQSAVPEFSPFTRSLFVMIFIANQLNLIAILISFFNLLQKWFGVG